MTLKNTRDLSNEEVPSQERREKNPRFDAKNLIRILEVSSDIVCICRDGVITDVNSVAINLLGAGVEEGIVGKPFADFLASEYSTAIDDFIDILAQEDDPFPAKLIALDGNEIGVNINLFKAREINGEYAVILARDVTHQVRMSEAIHRSEARYRKLVNNALDLICTCNNGKINYINEAGIAMLGINNSSEVIGRHIADIFHPDYYEIFTENLNYLVSEDTLFPTRLIRSDSTYLDVEVDVNIFDISASNLMIEARDITEHNQAVEALYQANKNLEKRVEERTRELTEEINLRKEVEEKLRHTATHDGLTGLPNRGLFIDRIHSALARGKRENEKFALLFIDLDGFKAINDTLGHEAGDKLLIEAANRISAHIRETDTAARFGGDEFVILLSDISGQASVKLFAEKISEYLSAPYPIGTAQGEISASIGISLYPDDASESDPLLQAADEAMYRVKKEGRNGFRFASEEVPD
ncbi:MAG: sensor domain-containing diguanylate cyclase [Rhodospirillales bacterium]|nr:sensor domain-containing diguanylate cyclase [Rhodospirillales bacterium]